MSSSSSFRAPHAFLEKTKALLLLEHEEEKEQCLELLKRSRHSELADLGVAILKLYTHSGVTTGLYGRMCAVFQRYNSEDALPSHRFSSGDIVGVFDGHSPIHELKPLAEGVVNRVRAKEIEVVFSQMDESFGHDGPFNLAQVASDVTMARYKYALSDLEASIAREDSRVVSLCFQDGAAPRLQEETRMDVGFKSHVTEGLNEPQQEAVKRSLLSQDLHIIHGPPGTGKTTTCVAFILECCLRKMRLLVCAPSNVAVDNLLMRVAPHMPNQVVRIGHPARIGSDLHKYTLDSRVCSSEEHGLCRDIEKEIKQHLDSLRKSSTAKAGSKARMDKSEKYMVKGELTKLRKELKKRSTDAVNAVLKRTQVVFSTCAGASEVKKRYLSKGLQSGDTVAAAEGGAASSSQLFDIVLVDEAAQTLEVACWIPLLCGKRAVLAGDHNQLAATVKSKEAMRKGLDKTLFGRMHERHGDAISSLLSIQYRMNEIIMGWSSTEFYDGRLVAAEEVKDQTLGLVVGGEEDDDTDKVISNHPMVFVDTSGNELCREDQSDGASVSRFNTGEANLVLFYIQWLVRNGISPKTTSICVISPYNQQVDTIRLLLAEAGLLQDVPVNTVDSFQGREADIVILSLVRSNDNGEVGFLSDFRRLNVAVTRARKHVLIVGNSQTICSDEVLGSLYGYALERGKVVFAAHMDLKGDASGLNAKCPFDLERTTATGASTTKKGKKMQLNFISEEPTEGKGKASSAAPAKKAQKNTAKSSSSSSSSGQHRQPAADVPTQGPDDKTEQDAEHGAEGAGDAEPACRPAGEPAARPGPGSEPGSSAGAFCPPQRGGPAGQRKKPAPSPQGPPEKSSPKPSVPQQPCKLGTAEGSSPAAPAVEGAQNDLLAGLARERQARQELLRKQQEDAERDARHKKLQAKKERKGSGKKEEGTDPKSIDDDEFESLLSEFQEGHSKCAICKASVRHLLDKVTKCQYCKSTFCLAHIQAESHGCGDAAARRERSSFQKQGPDPRANAVSKVQHRQAESKLSSVLKEKADMRAKKTGDKKK